MAVATGAIVGNLYYLQPVLHSAATSLKVGTGAAGTLVTLTQLGYAAGLLLIVPLGDLHPRRNLVVLLVLLAVLVFDLLCFGLLTAFWAGGRFWRGRRRPR